MVGLSKPPEMTYQGRQAIDRIRYFCSQVFFSVHIHSLLLFAERLLEDLNLPRARKDGTPARADCQEEADRSVRLLEEGRREGRVRLGRPPARSGADGPEVREPVWKVIYRYSRPAALAPPRRRPVDRAGRRPAVDRQDHARRRRGQGPPTPSEEPRSNSGTFADLASQYVELTPRSTTRVGSRPSDWSIVTSSRAGVSSRPPRSRAPTSG